MLKIPVWQFFAWGKAIKRDRVSDSIAMAQAIGLALDGGKEIQESWRITMEEPIVPPVVVAKAVEEAIEPKKKDKRATLQKLAKLFGEYG
jgi:hypothetical protein